MILFLTATFFHCQPANDAKCCFSTFFQTHLIKKVQMHFFCFQLRKSQFRDREVNISHFRLHRKEIASMGEIPKIQNLSTNCVQRICVENSKLVFKSFLLHLIRLQKNGQHYNQKWGQSCVSKFVCPHIANVAYFGKQRRCTHIASSIKGGENYNKNFLGSV